jgi:TonB family protein
MTDMKYVHLIVLVLIFLFSCTREVAVTQLEENGVTMIGGKSALLESLVYPPEAIEKGIEGVVSLMAYIDTNGIVRNCRVLEGNDYLNESAIRALRQQRFKPHIINGQKRPVQVIFPIKFAIARDIDIKAFEREKVLKAAEAYLDLAPVSLANDVCDRSPGGPQAYYSESLHWWPQHSEPEAAWVYRDSINPDVFRRHSELLAETGRMIAMLGAAYRLSKKPVYAKAAIEHLRKWFIEDESAMEAHFSYAQAIPNRSEGRVSGLYESLPLAEIILCLPQLEKYLAPEELSQLRRWFRDFAVSLEQSIFPENSPSTGSNTALLLYLLIADYLNDDLALEKAETYFNKILMPFLLSADSPLFNREHQLRFDTDIFIQTELLGAMILVLEQDGYDLWQQVDEQQYSPAYVTEYLYREMLNENLYPTEYYRGRYLFFLFAGKRLQRSEYLEFWKRLQEREAWDFALRQPLLWDELMP